MKLSVEILAHFLAQEKAQVIFPQLQLNAEKIVEMQCYQTLRKIQDTQVKVFIIYPRSGYHNFFTIHYYLLLQSPKGIFSEK